MPPISTSVEVNRPAGEVFAYATDPTRFHEWQNGVLDGRMDEQGTPRVGTHCLTTRQIGLAKRQVTAEVTHIDPPSLRTCSTASAMGTVTVSPVARVVTSTVPAAVPRLPTVTR
jgi:Polyketide cyclase / dehydrase and lipid transport